MSLVEQITRALQRVAGRLRRRPAAQRVASAGGWAPTLNTIVPDKRSPVAVGSPALMAATLAAAPVPAVLERAAQQPPARRGVRRRDNDAGERELDQALGGALRFPGAVALLSPKGGVGKTTLALVLGDLLAAQTTGRVAIMDCDPDFGCTVALAHRDSRFGGTLADIIDQAAEHGHVDVVSYATVLPSGAHLYAAPTDGKTLATLMERPEVLHALVELIRPHYDVLLLDLGAGVLNKIAQAATRSCDHAVVVTEPSPTTTAKVIEAIEHLARQESFENPDRDGPALMSVVINLVAARQQQRLAPIIEEFEQMGLRPVAVPESLELREVLEWGAYELRRMPLEVRVAFKRIALMICPPA